MFGEFWLDRLEDESGVSGDGLVAQGFVFNDGTVALRWVVPPGSTAVYQSIKDVERIHGHGGRTLVIWKSQEQSTQ